MSKKHSIGQSNTLLNYFQSPKAKTPKIEEKIQQPEVANLKTGNIILIYKYLAYFDLIFVDQMRTRILLKDRINVDVLKLWRVILVVKMNLPIKQ